jgi:hypothetical protein
VGLGADARLSSSAVPRIVRGVFGEPIGSRSPAEYCAGRPVYPLARDRPPGPEAWECVCIRSARSCLGGMYSIPQGQGQAALHVITGGWVLDAILCAVADRLVVIYYLAGFDRGGRRRRRAGFVV